MSTRKRTRIGEKPRICCHKPNHSAYINLNGKRHYLGRFGSAESKEKRDRLWNEYKTARDSLHDNTVTVSVLVARFLEWAETNYVKNDRYTGTHKKFKIIVQPLLELYKSVPVTEFGPLALKAVRNSMIESKTLCRNSINERVGGIRRIFQWGVSEELVPETVYRALMTVSMLKEGKTSAVDHPPVEEAPLEDVLKTVAVCHKVLGDMIMIQLLAAMRPQEVRLMRACDIDRSDDIWIYTPHEHKTEHRGKTRTIPILPESQAILTPYLIANETTPEAYLFSPQKAVKAIAVEKRAGRKTPVQPSQQGRRKGRGKGKPVGDCYTKNAYGTAIERAAKRAGVPNWSPNQLRHTMATAVKNNLDIEAAQHLLGHSSSKTTEIYLDPKVEYKKQVEKIKEVARKIAEQSVKVH